MKITNKIHFRNVQGNILGGLTVAVVALTTALAFSITSAACASAGLWGAILVGFFAALFGGTPKLYDVFSSIIGNRGFTHSFSTFQGIV